MAGLSATLSSIARYQNGLSALHNAAGSLLSGFAAREAPAGNTSFGANPGALGMQCHLPAGLPRGAALVVVLHGCGQTAGGYAAGAGWIELADRFGFALLMPEQQRGNNAGGCFNWFVPEDTTRGHGEAASIRAMTQHMVTTHALDPGRVFVTGLSAGGAMANALLATYPDVFAAGAIVAGLPYGGATSMQSALELMYHGRQRGDRDWGDAVRAAAGHRGVWPRVAVWQGLADTTVIPANGTDIVRQWLDVHGLACEAGVRDEQDGATHVAWGDPARPAVELYTLPHLSHGVPISAQDPDADRRCGAPGAHILEAGVSSSYLIARSWGLTGERLDAQPAAAPGGVAAIIQKALTAAGLKTQP